jgi:hypothetical protein
MLEVADALSKNPIAPDSLPLIQAAGVSAEYLAMHQADQREAIRKHVGVVATALLEQGSPEVPVENFYDEEGFFDELGMVNQQVENFYDRAEMVNQLFYTLGATNTLQDTERYDAAYFMGGLANQLKAEYEALPEAERTPEMRMTEGLLREEVALLWQNTTLEAYRDHPYRDFMFDLEDPSLFTPGDIESLSEEQRWLLVGEKLYKEAAVVFREIFQSHPESKDVRLEASCRTTDMHIRAMQLRQAATSDPEERARLGTAIRRVNSEFMNRLENVWELRQDGRGSVLSTGKWFQLFAVGEERDGLLGAGSDNWVRLSTPREELRNENVPRLLVEGTEDERVSLSMDVVVHGFGGEFIQGLQIKAMTRQEFERKEAARKPDVGTRIYLPGRIEMRFAEDYVNNSLGFDVMQPGLGTK